MAAPTFDVRAGKRVTGPRAIRPEVECLRYRLDVLAVSALDVVQSTGGWLYDRVMAGWEVTALLPRGCDTRPLRILGVAVSELRSAFDGTAPETAPVKHGLAVSAEAFLADASVRREVLAALDDRLTEVALWGDGWPLGVARATARAQHALSAAARTFKGHALAAAGMTGVSVGPTETLLCDADSRLDW